MEITQASKTLDREYQRNDSDTIVATRQLSAKTQISKQNIIHKGFDTSKHVNK